MASSRSRRRISATSSGVNDPRCAASRGSDSKNAANGRSCSRLRAASLPGTPDVYRTTRGRCAACQHLTVGERDEPLVGLYDELVTDALQSIVDRLETASRAARGRVTVGRLSTLRQPLIRLDLAQRDPAPVLSSG